MVLRCQAGTFSCSGLRQNPLTFLVIAPSFLFLDTNPFRHYWCGIWSKCFLSKNWKLHFGGFCRIFWKLVTFYSFTVFCQFSKKSRKWDFQFFDKKTLGPYPTSIVSKEIRKKNEGAINKNVRGVCCSSEHEIVPA